MLLEIRPAGWRNPLKTTDGHVITFAEQSEARMNSQSILPEVLRCVISSVVVYVLAKREEARNDLKLARCDEAYEQPAAARPIPPLHSNLRFRSSGFSPISVPATMGICAALIHLIRLSVDRDAS